MRTTAKCQVASRSLPRLRWGRTKNWHWNQHEFEFQIKSEKEKKRVGWKFTFGSLARDGLGFCCGWHERFRLCRLSDFIFRRFYANQILIFYVYDFSTFSLLRFDCANIWTDWNDAKDHDPDGVCWRLSHSDYHRNKNDWLDQHAADWQGFAASSCDCAWKDYLRRKGFVS